MGHAHHTLPLIYLEEARAAFWRELTGSASLDAIDYVMAEVTLRFHARTHYPGDVEVSITVDHVGSKSFSMLFELHDEDGTLLSSGRAVQVAFDYELGESCVIRSELRAALLAWLAAARA
jgi:acyl-CoA thioesterase FadM